MGLEPTNNHWFDTLTLNTGSRTQDILEAAAAREINLRAIDENTLGLSMDETTTEQDLVDLWDILIGDHSLQVEELAAEVTA